MKKIASLALSMSLFVASVGVVSAASVDISSNGSHSWNSVAAISKNSSKTVQKNTAYFSNKVTTISSTGGNTANKNTDGDVSIETGASTTETAISNTANVNTAVDPSMCGCGCDNGLTDLTIDHNGDSSHNHIYAKNICSDKTIQKNKATIKNNVFTVSETGGNTANSNTGGSVDVTTGESSTTVIIENTANSNSAGLVL